MCPTNAAKYNGRLDEAALARAFELLSARHPVLRGRIRRDRRGYLLYVPEAPYTEPMLIDGDEGTLRHEAAKPWDGDHGMAQLIIVRGEREGFVGLRVNHAIVNFKALIAIFGELWELYTDIVNGCDVSVVPGVSLPSPPSDLFLQRWGEIESTAPTESGNPTPALPPTGASGPIFRRIRLSEKDTSQLIAAAHARSTSVHALISGAITLALHTHGSSTDPASMIIGSLVDLRRHASPPVGATETTVFTGGHASIITVHRTSDPIEIGREIKRQLEAALANREVLISGLLTKGAAKINALRSAHRSIDNVGINNVGVIPRFAQPEDLTITDFVLNRPSEIPPMLLAYHTICTYAGRLSISCMYSSARFTHRQVDHVIEEITEQVSTIVRSCCN